jgi:ribosomal protein S18 acetylase RimI-like enzyme
MHPRGAIEAFLRRDPALHVYELGDLDPRQAPHVVWYAHGAPIDAVALVYRGLAVPTLIALGDDEPAALQALARSIGSIELPPRCYAHVTSGLERLLAARADVASLGRHIKMVLRSRPPDHDDVRTLGPRDADALAAFYAEHYPGSYFEPASVLAGPYVAVFDARGLACAAGVHVFSPAMGVAALGNIATRADARGRGLARRVTEALCARLARHAGTIGLNVAADNTAAIRCYTRVGFVPCATYEEITVTARPAASAPR